MSKVITNLIPWSEDLSKWNLVGTTVAEDRPVGPIPGTYGSRVTFSAVADACCYVSATTTQLGEYMPSLWVRADVATTVQFLLSSVTSGTYDSGDIPVSVTTEWSRISLPVTISSFGSDTGLQLQLVTRDSVARTIDVFGVMLDYGELLNEYVATTEGVAMYRTIPEIDTSVVGQLGQSTLLLDVESWDLCVDAYGNIAVAKDPYSVAQDVASAIRLMLGEAYYDTSRGVPYLTQILGEYPPIDLIRTELADAAMSVQGVTAATCVITDFSNRKLSGTVKFTTATGATDTVSF